MNVCIYGGGNIAHSTAETLAMHQPVTVLTHHPADWNPYLDFTKDGTPFRTKFKIDATADVCCVEKADIVFITVPQYGYETALAEIETSLKTGSTVVFMPAPAKSDDYAGRLLKRGVNVVGFQRVPNVSRIVTHGKSVTISADRPTLRLAISKGVDKDTWQEYCAKWFGANADYLSSFLIFKFSNSNPLLHPSRMVVLFDNWRNRTYPTNPLFYAEWTDESSELYLAADDELAMLIAQCPEIDAKHDYIPIRAHYGVNTPKEMTAKLRSIPSFQSLRSPMKQVNGTWIPDFTSRYFTEDVDCGLKAMVEESNRQGNLCPICHELLDTITSIRS